MTTAATLSSLVNSSNRIVVPSGGINFGTSTDGTGSVISTVGGIFDDYEEGSFNPTTSGVTIGTENTLAYTKIGRIVFIQGRINFADAGSGEFYLNNFPFTSGSTSTMPEKSIHPTFNVHFILTAANYTYGIASYMLANDNKVRFRDAGGFISTGANLADHVDSGTYMYISGYYFVD